MRVSIQEHPQTRLKAYATLTFDQSFVVRNVKVIAGRHGLFVAMPSRKPKVGCAACRFRNESGSRFCSQCGIAISRPAPVAGAGDLDGPEAIGHRDIAHPITVEFRQYLQHAVLDAYEAERARGVAVHPSGAGGGDDEAL